MATPQKEAYTTMRQEGVSPRKKPRLAKDLIAFHTMVENIKHAPMAIKTKLLANNSRKRRARCSSYLAKKIGVSRQYIQNIRKKRATKCKRDQER